MPTVIPEQAYILGSVSHEMEHGARSLPPAGAVPGPGSAQADTDWLGQVRSSTWSPRNQSAGYLSTFYFFSTSSERKGPLFLGGGGMWFK